MISQGSDFNSWSGPVQEATNECTCKWNYKSRCLFLPLPPSLPIPFPSLSLPLFLLFLSKMSKNFLKVCGFLSTLRCSCQSPWCPGRKKNEGKVNLFKDAALLSRPAVLLLSVSFLFFSLFTVTEAKGHLECMRTWVEYRVAKPIFKMSCMYTF